MNSKYFTSSKVTTCMEVGKETAAFDVNLRYVYGLRSIGKGPTAGRTLAGIFNLPSPPKHFIKFTNLLGMAVKDICIDSMTRALEESLETNYNGRGIIIALDGTCQKCGHTSQNGVISATNFDTGKVVDVPIMSKFCKCK